MLAEAARLRAPFQSKSFRPKSSGAEHFITVSAPPELNFKQQVEHLRGRYAEAMQSLGLGPESAVFRRLFLSDAINQAAFVRESALFRDLRDNPVAVSILEQAPLDGAKISLLAYHVSGGGATKRRLSPKHVLFERQGARHLWSTRLCAGAGGAASSIDTQTWDVFSELIGAIAAEGGNLRDHCVRTWIYIKDVDVSYRGMVDARGRIFRHHGLTEQTHYIASTGIQGACPHQFDHVLMDAYSALDLMPRQMTYLQDLDRLCPTKNYNVHFERGAKLSYADRAHSFISGTASIDSAGMVVHPGNVGRQLVRALSNVDALLASGGAELSDMSYFIVYLRDRSDYRRIHDALRERFPSLPMAFVAGAVCRPEWLVEIEGVAVSPKGDSKFAAF